VSPLAAVTLVHRPGEVAEAARALLDGIPTGKDGGGIDAADLARATELLGAAGEPVTVILGRQSIAESDAFAADAASALLAGLPGVTFLPAVRRSNVRGALDMGLAPGFLPGRVTLDDGRDWFEQVWATTPATTGLDATGILTAAAAGSIEVLILLGADPLADFPDRDLAARALAAVPTIISCDLFLTESTELAHIVLPAAGHAEKDGTTTNIEGRVTRLGQRVTPPGTARADWMIAAELAFQLGSDLMLESADDIWDEIVTLAPAYRDLEVEALEGFVAGDGVLVPFPTLRAAAYGGNGDAPPADAAGATDDNAEDETDAAAVSVAPDPDAEDDAPADAAGGSGDADEPDPVVDDNPAPDVFRLVPSAAIEPAPLDAYALRLVASRKLYDDGTLVQQSPSLAPLVPGTVLRINGYDFARLGVAVGAQVRVKTPKGQAMVEIQVDEGVPRGVAAVHVNQPGLAVTSLLDATARVTDLRVDSGADA